VTSLFGIAETSPDVFVLAGGNFSIETAVGIPGTFSVWEADFNRQRLSDPGRTAPAVRKIADLPQASLLNGLIALDSNNALISDSGLGLIWRLDTVTGSSSVYAQDTATMLPLPDGILPIGVNGIKIHDGYLYYSTGNRASIYRYALPFSPTASISNATHPQLVSEFEDERLIDDLVVGDDGDIWAFTNAGNTVQEINVRDGSHRVVVGSLGALTVAGDTAGAIGRTRWDSRTLYVVTGGGAAAPVNGTITEPAKVVAVDTIDG
jgi:hypothetical protein